VLVWGCKHARYDSSTSNNTVITSTSSVISVFSPIHATTTRWRMATDKDKKDLHSRLTRYPHRTSWCSPSSDNTQSTAMRLLVPFCFRAWLLARFSAATYTHHPAALPAPSSFLCPLLRAASPPSFRLNPRLTGSELLFVFV